MTKSLINKKRILNVLLLALLIALPTNSFSQDNTSISNNNGKSKIHITNNGKDFKIEYEGDITLSDDDKDIIAISNGGFIEIERSSFGSKRRIVVESDRNGKLLKKYYEGRKEKDFNPDGKKWLAEVLQEIVRTTTIGAQSRLNRFYSKGGANAVLGEIERIESDYVKDTYFKLLLEKNLSNGDLVNVIKRAGEEIESDHYLASILTSNQKAFLSSGQTISAYLEAAKSLDSDHYLTSVLKQVINDKAINDNQMESFLELSKSIKSDHYVTEVLIEVMKNRELNSQNITKIISLSKDIESDHYKAEVLTKVINSKGMSSDAYDAFIDTLDDIDSDHYVSEVILELLDNKLDASTASLSKLLDMVKRSVQSDHYASSIYKKMSKQDLTEDQLITTLESISSLQSGHYKSEALKSFANKVKRSSESVKSAYRTAAKSINSDTYYSQAMKAID